MKIYLRFLRRFASIDILLLTLIGLMLLIYFGTVEQESIGLFKVQEIYFHSFWYWYKFIPLPGGKTLLLIFGINLIAQLITRSNFKNFKKIGINIAHIGSIFLIFSSFYLFSYTTDGSINLLEGESVGHYKDFKKFTLTINYSNYSSNKNILYQFPIDHSLLQEFNFDGHNIKVQKVLENCLLKEKKRDDFIGFASQFEFTKAIQYEKRESDLCLEFDHQSEGQKSKIGIFHLMPRIQSLNSDKSKMTFQIENLTHSLPFQIKLIHFKKEYYQDTMIAKSYKSIVSIKDQEKEFQSTIEMNRPLRYKGYTFYQAAFSESSNGNLSQLSVSKNHNNEIPYFSSLIISLGLLIHLIIVIFNSRIKNA